MTAYGMSYAVGGALPAQARPFVPTAMAPKLAYRRGKWEGGKKPAWKYQIRGLNPRRETKIQGANREVSEGKADL